VEKKGDMSEPSEYSESGNPIYRHEASDKPLDFAMGNQENIDAIARHIEGHVGEYPMVFHEIVSHLVHIDIHFVGASAQRPYHTLITSGMSDKPMTVPEGMEEFRYAELMMCLPPDWPMTEDAFKDERWFWPIRTLKLLARMPHEYDTWLCIAHTIPNGDPPEAYPGTPFCCALIAPPQLFPDEFFELKMAEDKVIHFYAVVPIFQEEMDLKLKKGADELWERFDEHKVSELLDLKRVNTAKKRFGIF
jgi:hypothetical protein